MGFQVDWYNNLILVTSPQTEVLIQELYNFLQDTQQSLPGMNYEDICGATGKDALDEDISTGITLSLYSPWQIKFWDGEYIASIKGGNLVGGIDGDTIAYTPDVQVLIIQSAASTIVQTGGSSLTQAEHNKLMNGIDNKVSAFVASDNGTIATIGIWADEFGDSILDIDQIEAILFDLDGNVIIDLGIQTNQTPEGVFKYTIDSSLLSNNSSYYLNIHIIRGIVEWTANVGLSTAS